MLSAEQAIAVLTHELGEPSVANGAVGEYLFDLDGPFPLGVYRLPDGSGLVAWSAVAEARPGETAGEAEARAASFLRAHLGRLRPAGAVTATRSPEGTDILYIRAVPATEEEWLRAVEHLLNETDAMRAILSAAGGQRGGSTPAAASLFSGRSGLLGGGSPTH
ncbi:MAG: hypothetical protein LIP77_10990 [Planctomycetes bacterium]|nr:hypothetical protein [Planctomycetota bacterium]